MAWRIRKRWLSRYSEALAGRDGLLALYRYQLQEDRRGVRLSIPMLLSFSLVMPALPFLPGLSWASPGPSDFVILWGASALMACVAIYLWRAQLPRLDRQLRELA